MKRFWLSAGDQARVDVLETQDANFNPLAHAPAGYPARRSHWWIRSMGGDVARYFVEQQNDGGDWETPGIVHDDAARWTYSFFTPRIEDLAKYS